MKKIIQKTKHNVVVCILNFPNEIIVGGLYNSALITAGVLLFLTVAEAVEAFSETPWSLG